MLNQFDRQVVGIALILTISVLGLIGIIGLLKFEIVDLTIHYGGQVFEFKGMDSKTDTRSGF